MYLMSLGHLGFESLNAVNFIQSIGSQFCENAFVLFESDYACRVIAAVLQEFDTFEADLMGVIFGGENPDDSTAVLDFKSTFFWLK